MRSRVRAPDRPLGVSGRRFTARGPRLLTRIFSPFATSWVIGPLLFASVLSVYLLSFNVDKPTHNADWFVRYQVTCNLVEHNQFSVVPYQNDGRTGIGQNGLIYSQYTLGQSAALIPFYLMGRSLAGVAHTNCAATVPPAIVFLAAKLLDLVVGALLAVLMCAMARLLGYSRPIALTLSLILAFGSSLWPDVLSNEEHTMESLFLLASSYAALSYVKRRSLGPLWLLIMGLSAGLVFVTRVAGLLALPIFPIFLFFLHRHWKTAPFWRLLGRDVAVYALGILPSILLNGWFNAIRFGSPLRTGPKPDESFGFPPWIGLPDLLVSPGKGILWYSPVVLLLFLVAVPFWKRQRSPAVLFSVLIGCYLIFYANITYWHGDPSWGPRYLFALLPYAILPLGDLFRYWRQRRRVTRLVVVVVVAASILVQLSSVSVSYWRNWHFIYGYHYDQVENHGWGQNLNYWWNVEQAPILLSLQGIGNVTQNYIDHAPLVTQPQLDRLSDPTDSCVFPVEAQVSLCLTDVDELRVAYPWNTFTMWWVHSFPWWSQGTVVALALSLAGVAIASMGAVVGLVSVPLRKKRKRGRDEDAVPLSAGQIAAIGESIRVTNKNGSVQEIAPSSREANALAGLRVFGVAALVAILTYAGIVNVAALTTPRQAAVLYRTVPMSATIRDVNWAYQVLNVTRLQALPTGFDQPPDTAHKYAIVRLRIFNLLSRPQHVKLQYFALTDSTGVQFPLAGNSQDGMRINLAELYHLAPIGMVIPAKSAVDNVVAYVIRSTTGRLELLGPGITMVQLQG